jgi:hypothetical protein
VIKFPVSAPRCLATAVKRPPTRHSEQNTITPTNGSSARKSWTLQLGHRMSVRWSMMLIYSEPAIGTDSSIALRTSAEFRHSIWPLQFTRNPSGRFGFHGVWHRYCVHEIAFRAFKETASLCHPAQGLCGPASYASGNGRSMGALSALVRRACAHLCYHPEAQR